MNLLTGTNTKNVAIGPAALGNAQSGTDNIAIGYTALGALNGGTYNVAIGTESQFSGTGNGYSVSVGYQSLKAGASFSVAIGGQALINATGNNNTAIGMSAGYYLQGATLGSENTFLGAQADVPSSSVARGRTAIGFDAKSDTDYKAVLGGDTTTVVQFGSSTSSTLTSVVPAKAATAAATGASLGTSSFPWSTVYAWAHTVVASDGRVKDNQRPIFGGLATLLQLRPKTYFKRDASFSGGTLSLGTDGMEEAGFIAQELVNVIPSAVIRPADENKTLWSVRYEHILPYTVSAVQELKAENDQLRSELDTLKAEMAEIKALLKK